MKLALVTVLLAFLGISAEASLLAVTRDGRVLRVDPDPGTASLVASTGLADVQALERSPDGVYYAIAEWNRLVAIDPASGRSRSLAALPYSFVADLAHEPGGTRLLAAADADAIGEAEALVEIDPVAGTSVRIGAFDDPDSAFDTPLLAFGLAFAPDASLLASLFAVSPSDAFVAAVDPGSGRPAEGTPMPGIFSGLDSAPDGTLYAVEHVLAGATWLSFAVAIDPPSGSVTRVVSEPLGAELAPGDCANGADDDGDGAIDGDDPGCQVWALDAEPLTPDCVDGADDDGDGLVDLDDPGCRDAADPSERAIGLPCDDGLDEDGDGAIDATGGAGVGADPQCGGSALGRESAASCGLGGELPILIAALARLGRRLRSRAVLAPHDREG